MNDPTEIAFHHLAHRLPTWPRTALLVLVHHPRRCAPDFASYCAVTGLPPQLAHRLWTTHEPAKDTAA